MRGCAEKRGRGGLTTVVFAGVGGQGVLSAARLLGDTAHGLGTLVTVSQLHDMSQRGGAVQASVRLGSDALVPIERRADVVIGFEAIEALRAGPFVGPGTTVLCSTHLRPPPAIAQGGRRVPDLRLISRAIAARGGLVLLLDAPAIAAGAGADGSVGAVLLGALSAVPGFPVPAEALLQAVRGAKPAGSRTTAAAAAAFEAGRAAHAAAQHLALQPPAT